MRDDPESIAIRKHHADMTLARGEIDEMAAEIETIATTRPTPFALLLARLVRWIRRMAARDEEEARIAARETYDD